MSLTGRGCAHLALPRFNRDTRLLIAASGIFAVSFYGIQMLLRVLYVLRLGNGPEYVGLFGASGALTFMSMGLPSGALGRRLGVRKTMLLGGAVTVVGMALLPVTEFLPAQAQAVWPIASQMVRTVGWSMFSVNLVPALMAATRAEERSQAYAVNSVLRGLGTFLGTVAGGLLPALFARVLSTTLDAPLPYGCALWAGASLGLVALVPLSRIDILEQGSAGERAEGRGSFPLATVSLMVLYVYLSHGGWAVSQVFSNAYMDTILALPTVMIGLITGVGQFAAILTPLLNPWLARQRGDGWTLMITSLGIGISLVPLALIPHWAGVAVGRTGVLALSAMWLPALHVFQMKVVELQWRSLAYGAVSTMMGLSFGTISLAGGYIVAAAGYRTIFLLGAVLCAAGTVLMWFVLKRQDKQKEVDR